MKNRVLKYRRIALYIFAVLAVLTVVAIFKNTIILNKSYAYDVEAITNIAQFVDEGNQNDTSASFILQNIDDTSIELLDGHKYKVFSTNNDITLTLYDTITNEEIPMTNNTFALNETGVTVKVDGISRGNTYDVKIQPVESAKGYKPSYSEATVELDYTDVLTASIKQIKDNNNNPIALGENDRVVFLYTDINDKIRLRANTNIDIEYLYSLAELSEEELANATFTAYDKANYLQVTTNGYLYAKAKYQTDNYSRISMLRITNIDRLKPIVTVTDLIESDTRDSATINFSIDDAEATSEYGKSGFKKYAFSNYEELTSIDEWIETTAGSFTRTVTDNGTYYIHAMDNVGNVKVEPVNVNIISYEQEGYYILILNSTNADLIGKVYRTLMEMKEDFEAHNLTNNDTVIAQIEGDIKNQYIDVENVNLTIDLNGYIIESREVEPTFNIKDGATLKIVDNKYRIKDYISYLGTRICTNIGDPVNYYYSGEENTYIAPADGQYKLETWGAQGGYAGSEEIHGGYGGYTTGIATLTEGQTLYINVGQQGLYNDSTGTNYNGGGTGKSGSQKSGAGGGATHIATQSGLLSTLENNKDSIIMVAGGGGGASNHGAQSTTVGGNAGGYIGVNGTSNQWAGGRAGSQTAGGASVYNNTPGGSFGQGGVGIANAGGGGGAGYYGGSGGNGGSGGGGSSYFKASVLLDPKMYCNNCAQSSDDNTLTISVDTHSNEPQSNTPKEGEGFARITRLSCEMSDVPYDYALFKHGTNPGTIKNVNHNAINVNPGATLQIGEDNSPDLAHIEYPDHTSPYISGKEKAITNRGTFNYYDGIIYGGIALDGEPQDTPYIYDPSVVIAEDGHNYRMTLEKVTNVEALIGKTRYTLLEDAIDVANRKKGTPEDQIKIDIVSDLSKDLVIEVNDQKNIKLDLNGHTFTNTISEPVIVNYGKLVIMDSGANGNIISHNTYTIHNKSTTGQFILESGSILNDANKSYALYNDADAVAYINGGTVSQTNAGTTMYNDGGILTVNGGSHIANDNWQSIYSAQYSIVYNQDKNSETIVDETTNVPLATLNTSIGGWTYSDDGSISPNCILNNTMTTARDDVYKTFDLTEYGSQESFKIELDVEQNIGESDYFYVYYRNDNNSQTYGTQTNRVVYEGGQKDKTTYSFIVQGGKLYNVHFGFQKAYGSPEEYYVKVSNLKISKLHIHPGRVTIAGGEFSTGRWSLMNHSYHNETYINDGLLNAHYSLYTVNGDVTINGGTLTTTAFNEKDETVYINGGNIAEFANYDGTVYMTGGKVGKFYNRWNDNRYYLTHENNYFYMSGGEIYDYVDNYQTMDIANATISGTVYHYAEKSLKIENTSFSKTIENQGNGTFYSVLIDTPTGDVTMKNVSFEASIGTMSNRYEAPKYYAINKAGDSKLGIDNITMNLNGIFGFTGNLNNNVAKFEFLYGICNTGDGDIYINNTKIEVSTDNERLRAYGIHNTGKGELYIGKKDGNYDEINQYIKSNFYAVYSPQGFIHLYDGYFRGEDIASDDVINETEDEYYVYRYDDNGADKIKLVTNGFGNILNVSTNTTYNSLGEALAAAGTTATLRYLNDYSYETINVDYSVDENQEITIDLNGKKIYMGNNLTNNGTLKIVDNSNETSSILFNSIINNNIMSVEAGHWTAEYDDWYGFKNNGKLTIKNSTIDVVYAMRGEPIFENNGELFIENGTTLDGLENAGAKILYNKEFGRAYLNGGTLRNTKNPEHTSVNVSGRLITNEGGYVNINGSTLEGYSRSYYGTANSIDNMSTIPAHIDGIEQNSTIYLSGSKYTTIPVDLSQYSGDVTVKVKFSMSEYRDQKSYWDLTTSETRPKRYTYSNETLYETVYTGKHINDIYSKEVTGGNMYYLYVETDSSINATVIDIIIEQNSEQTHMFKHGVIVMDSGTINDNCTHYTIRNYNSYIENNGVTINNITNGGYGITNYIGSSFKMTDGLIKEYAYGIYFDGYSSGTITGGDIKFLTEGYSSDIYGIYVNEGNVEAENLSIEIINQHVGNINKAGVYLKNNSQTSLKNCDIDMQVNAHQSYGVNAINTSVLGLNGTTINIRGRNQSQTETMGINAADTATVVVKDSDITSSSKTGYGVFTNGTNNISINNSSIVATGTSASYGYFANGTTTPAITISNEDTDADGHVSQTSPLISGQSYGIYRKGGTLNYYDGIIKGNEQIHGGVTSRPDGYELKYGNDGTLPTVVLEKLDVVENTTTHVTYSTLQAAFNACPNNEVCYLKEIYNINLNANQTIPAGKIIELDINEKVITTGEDAYIINQGTFKVSNGKLNSQGVDNEDSVIHNSGILYIEEDTTLTTNLLIAARILYNDKNGEIHINGGDFLAEGDPTQSGLSIYGRLLYNNGGYVEINNGTFKTFSRDYIGFGLGVVNVADVPKFDINTGMTEKEGTLTMGGNSASIIPIDLSQYSGNVKIKIKYNTSEYNNNPFYVSILDTDVKPRLTTDYEFAPAGEHNNDYIEKEVTGGGTYYIHGLTTTYVTATITDIIIEQNGEEHSLFSRSRLIINNIDYTDNGYINSILNQNSYIEVNDGTFKVTEETNGEGIRNFAGSEFKMTDGTFSNVLIPISFYGYSIGTITKGTFTHNGDTNKHHTAIYVDSGFVTASNLTINSIDMDYRSSSKTIFEAYKNSTIDVDNCSLSIKCYTDTCNAIKTEGNSQVKVTNSTISATSTRDTNSFYALYNKDSSEFTLENSSLTANAVKGYGFYTTGDNNINIINSSINVVGAESYGYKADNNSTPTITITNIDGDEDANVSTTMPIIKGDYKGIDVRAGTINFYDGIIKGGEESLHGGVYRRAPGYNLDYKTEGNYKTLTLKKMNVIKNTGTNTEYSSVQEAINACPNNEACNLTQIARVNIFEETTIPENKIVVYNGNNYILTTVNDHRLVNNGDFTYTGGTLQTVNRELSAIITNNGTLRITDGSTLTANDSVKARLIHNTSTGVVYINGGTLTADALEYIGGDTADGRVIYNEGGYVEINGGTINGNSGRSNITITNSIKNTSTTPEANGATEVKGTIKVGSNARANIPIDLSQYSGDVKVIVEYSTNVYGNAESLFAITTAPVTTYNTSDFDLITTNLRTNDTFEKTVQGGTTYYLTVLNKGSKEAFIQNITIQQGGSEKHLFNRPRMVINGGVINDNANNDTIIVENATFEMNGGTFNKVGNGESFGISLFRGSKAKITEGTINNVSSAIILDESSYAKIIDVNIRYDGKSSENWDIYGINMKNGTADIEDITINLDGVMDKQRKYNGIYLDNRSVLTLNGGDITVNPGGVATKSGIYVKSATATLNLGKNEGLVDQHNPHITGDTNGIYIENNDATFNFYDGRITSPNTQINGVVDNIPDDYQIVAEGNDYFLDIRSQIEDTFEYNKMYFEGLNMPIEVIRHLENKTGTIKLWNNATVHSQVVIPEGVEITLALEGHELDFDEGLEIGIINNGTLHIVDGFGDEIDQDTESTIVNLYGVAIQNNGTLTVGETNNPNRRSPVIKGTYGVTGNSATINSGGIISTEDGGILGYISSALSNLFRFEIEPSYSYKTSTYQINKLSGDTVLATSPTFRTVQSLDVWTRDPIDIGMTSHNVGILNLVTDRDPDQTKEIVYTIEVYKNGILDEFYTYKKIVNIQYLDDTKTLDVDLDWFDDVKTKFKEYYLSKMTINDEETNEVPEIVYDGTVFRLYYGQTKGEEIDLVNPKTGRKSYKLTFAIVLICSLALIGIIIGKYINKKQKAML